MIRSAVDMELFTDLGIVCVHAHIYTDRVADSEALQAQVEDIFKRVRGALEELGRLERRPDGSVRRATVSVGLERTRHGKGKRKR